MANYFVVCTINGELRMVRKMRVDRWKVGKVETHQHNFGYALQSNSNHLNSASKLVGKKKKKKK